MSVERLRAVGPGLRVYARQDSDQRRRGPLSAPPPDRKPRPDDEDRPRAPTSDSHLLDVTV
jgi:hypothetical protein